MSQVNRDTVEEAWDTSVLESCYERASQVETADFLNQLGNFLGALGKIWGTVSGRLALQQFLSDAVSPQKKSVMVCSFNCQVVADAVLNAGFQVETFDLADTTGRIDWGQVAGQLGPHHGAVVVPHLFGVPSDFLQVRESAEKLEILIVEDCAPTLGGKIGSSTAGTLGDAAIFSFNYDKPISLGGGGALLVNNPDLWSKIRLGQRPVGLERERRELEQFVTFLHKRRQSIRRPDKSLPRRILGRIKSIRSSRAGELFPVSGIGPLRAALGLWQLERYTDIVNRRNRNASFFSQEAKCSSWYVGSEVSPAWLRQKVIPSGPQDARSISRCLQRQGLRVGLFNWPMTLDKYLGLPEKPNASYVARNGLDVPIHQNMTLPELNLIRRAICVEAVE